MLRVRKHPDKTFIGRVERGFDFLGYFLKPEMVNVSISTLKRFALRISLLYEQSADIVSIGEYVRHWLKWVRSGVGAWGNMIAKECIKKHLHPSVLEECRRLYNESILVNNYLAIINSFLFPSSPYFCPCQSC
jgi:hypothetical protein